MSTAGRSKKQKCESHSKVRGSIRETPKTVTRETSVPMYHVLPHLSCISSISTDVFSRQLKAAEATGQCCSWQHAEEERYNTRYLLCQMSRFQTGTPDMDGSAHLLLAYSDASILMSHHIHEQQVICSTGHVS